MKWYIEDDHGLVHELVITGAYLIRETTTRILSPQHLAQQANDHYPTAKGTGALTTSKNITLFWAQRRFTKTVPLYPKTNVGLSITASGAGSFCAFCDTINHPETNEMNIFTTQIIPEEEDDESFQPKDPVKPDTQDENEQLKAPDEVMTEAPVASLLDMGPITHVIPDDQEPTWLDPHDELIQWHYRLGHLSFDRIKQLASTGQLPKPLLSCKRPFCSACQYGKMTMRPWRVKGEDKKATKTATRPGQIVSVDQLESNTPGLIAQLKVQVRYGICGSILRLHLCLPAKTAHQRRNSDGEARFRVFSQTTRSESDLLSRGQRPLRGQCLHRQLQSSKARAVLLQGRRPLPERDSGAPHKGPARANKNVYVICNEQMEMHGSHLLMALCHVLRQ